MRIHGFAERRDEPLYSTPRETGILFQGPMVCSILAGRKRQTRRLLGLDTLVASSTPGYDWTFRGKPPLRSLARQRRHQGGCWQDISHADLLALCPYGGVGDRLWVRETWQAWKQTNIEYDEWEPITRAERGGLPWSEWIEQNGRPNSIQYRATSESVGPWTPAIHMPRWASRITLEITEVRVQRLGDISDADAEAEGVCSGLIPADEYGPVRIGFVLGVDDGKCALWPSERAAFKAAWSMIHGPDAWVTNPWVYALNFKRIA